MIVLQDISYFLIMTTPLETSIDNSRSEGILLVNQFSVETKLLTAFSRSEVAHYETDHIETV